MSGSGLFAVLGGFGTDMNTVELTAADFERTITEGGITLVDFWASWCGPCRAFAPVFEEVAGAHPDHTFAKVDTEAEQELSGALGIQSIPTLMIFRDGVLMFSQPGALPKHALEDLVSQVEQVDMDDVRRQIADADPDADVTS